MLRLRGTGEGSDADVVEDEDPADLEEPERVVMCAQCAHEITKFSERLVVDGKHEHVRTNPHGYVYHIGCWRTAPGCGEIGQPSDEWSWFAGYTWRVVICRACMTQLGWSFSTADNGFFGLIVARVTEGDAD